MKITKWSLRLMFLLLALACSWLIYFGFYAFDALPLFIYFVFSVLISYQLFLFYVLRKFLEDKLVKKRQKLIAVFALVPVLIALPILFQPTQLEFSWPLILSLVLVSSAFCFLEIVGFFEKTSSKLEGLSSWLIILAVVVGIITLLLRFSLPIALVLTLISGLFILMLITIIQFLYVKVFSRKSN